MANPGHPISATDPKVVSNTQNNPPQTSSVDAKSDSLQTAANGVVVVPNPTVAAQNSSRTQARDTLLAEVKESIDLLLEFRREEKNNPPSEINLKTKTSREETEDFCMRTLYEGLETHQDADIAYEVLKIFFNTYKYYGCTLVLFHFFCPRNQFSQMLEVLTPYLDFAKAKDRQLKRDIIKFYPLIKSFKETFIWVLAIGKVYQKHVTNKEAIPVHILKVLENEFVVLDLPKIPLENLDRELKALNQLCKILKDFVHFSERHGAKENPAEKVAPAYGIDKALESNKFQDAAILFCYAAENMGEADLLELVHNYYPRIKNHLTPEWIEKLNQWLPPGKKLVQPLPAVLGDRFQKLIDLRKREEALRQANPMDLNKYAQEVKVLNNAEIEYVRSFRAQLLAQLQTDYSDTVIANLATFFQHYPYCGVSIRLFSFFFEFKNQFRELNKLLKNFFDQARATYAKDRSNFFDIQIQRADLLQITRRMEEIYSKMSSEEINTPNGEALCEAVLQARAFDEFTRRIAAESSVNIVAEMLKRQAPDAKAAERQVQVKLPALGQPPAPTPAPAAFTSDKSGSAAPLDPSVNLGDENRSNVNKKAPAKDAKTVGSPTQHSGQRDKKRGATDKPKETVKNVTVEQPFTPDEQRVLQMLGKNNFKLPIIKAYEKLPNKSQRFIQEFVTVFEAVDDPTPGELERIVLAGLSSPDSQEPPSSTDALNPRKHLPASLDVKDNVPTVRQGVADSKSSRTQPPIVSSHPAGVVPAAIARLAHPGEGKEQTAATESKFLNTLRGLSPQCHAVLGKTRLNLQVMNEAANRTILALNLWKRIGRLANDNIENYNLGEAVSLILKKGFSEKQIVQLYTLDISLDTIQKIMALMQDGTIPSVRFDFYLQKIRELRNTSGRPDFKFNEEYKFLCFIYVAPLMNAGLIAFNKVFEQIERLFIGLEVDSLRHIYILIERGISRDQISTIYQNELAHQLRNINNEVADSIDKDDREYIAQRYSLSDEETKKLNTQSVNNILKLAHTDLIPQPLTIQAAGDLTEPQVDKLIKLSPLVRKGDLNVDDAKNVTNDVCERLQTTLAVVWVTKASPDREKELKQRFLDYPNLKALCNLRDASQLLGMPNGGITVDAFLALQEHQQENLAACKDIILEADFTIERAIALTQPLHKKVIGIFKSYIKKGLVTVEDLSNMNFAEACALNIGLSQVKTLIPEPTQKGVKSSVETSFRNSYF